MNKYFSEALKTLADFANQQPSEDLFVKLQQYGETLPDLAAKGLLSYYEFRALYDTYIVLKNGIRAQIR